VYRKEFRSEEHNVGAGTMVRVHLAYPLTSRVCDGVRSRSGRGRETIGLASSSVAWPSEVLQVLVVHPDLALMFHTLDKVPPLLEGLDDCQRLLVMDLVVLFDGGQGLGEEGDWVPLFVFRRYLGERTRRKVRTVGSDAEGFGRVRRDEDQSGSDTSLQPSECGVLGFSPAPTGITLGQVEEQTGVFREVSDELSVEVGESKEGLHFLFIHRSGPLGNASDLDRVHRNGVVRDDHSKVFDRGFLELALVRMEVELMLLQQLQNAAGDLPVLFKGLHEDEDVVQIDHNYAF